MIIETGQEIEGLEEKLETGEYMYTSEGTYEVAEEYIDRVYQTIECTYKLWYGNKKGYKSARPVYYHNMSREQALNKLIYALNTGDPFVNSSRLGYSEVHTRGQEREDKEISLIEQSCGCKEDQSELCPVGQQLSTQSSAAFQKYMAYQRTNERVGVTRETMEKVHAASREKRTLFLKHILGENYESNCSQA
jgi:hypothetical protein